MNQYKRVSIIIPTYNRACQLAKTLDSVLCQTYQQWECIIVDDGSTDHTFAIAEDYQANDSRFLFVKNKRSKGAQGARNTGLEIAKGDWICFFDSDDLMYPNYLEEMLQSEDSGVDVLVCQANIVNIQTGDVQGVLDKIHSSNMHVDLLREKAYVAYDVTLIRRAKLLEMNLLDETCPSMQEWDTHIRLSRIANYKAIDNALCEWRVGGVDTITNNTNKHVSGLVYIYLKHRCDFRKYAYRHFLNVLSQVISKYHNSFELLMKVPELIIYIPIKKLYTLFYGAHKG